MKLQRLTLSGITVFKAPYTLDLAGRGKLVALVGRNGAGKSTLLEAVPAALFKGFPSRPASIYDYAHGRDAFIEATFHDGEFPVVARLAINAEARTMESYLMVDGSPVTTGRAAEYAAEVERLFGSEALLLASVFACQTKAGSFMYLPKAARKELLVEMLGLGRLEELADGAKLGAVRARAAAEQLGDAGGQLSVLRAAIESLDASLTAASNAEESACEELRVAQEDLEIAQQALSNAERADAGDVERLKAFTALQDAYDDALGRHKAAVAAHERRGGELTAAKARADRAAKDAEIDFDRRAGIIADRIGKWRALAERLPEIEHAASAVASVAALRKGTEQQISEARALVSTRHHEHKAAMSKLKRLEDAWVALRERAGLVALAPCTTFEAWPVPDSSMGEHIKLAATCPLLTDARKANAGIDAALQASVEALRAEELASAAHDGAMLALQAIPEVADVAPEVRQAAALLESAKAADENLATSQADLVALEQERAAKLPLLRRSVAADEQALGLWRGEKLPAEPAPPARPDIPPSAVPGCRVQLEKAKAEVAAAEKKGGDASREQARLDERVRELRSKLAEAEANVDRLKTARTDLAEWELLAQALGKDGAQALEIDAAGPAIAGVCNELLQACFDARFAISFETLKEKRSKPGEFSETFDIRVLDRGEERMVEALSGGEKVVVGEALSLALAITNARKNAIRWGTLFRDETSGALDPVAAAEYLNLLRRAMDFGGFEQCLFVAHQEQLWQAADSTVML